MTTAKVNPANMVNKKYINPLFETVVYLKIYSSSGMRDVLLHDSIVRGFKK
jgi:hypothetical protein